ncbi:MAG: hypothetical protein ABSC49_03165 [Candidatus Microgenomates bacterium]|jgi:Tfp pilus assembly protein PilN
MRVSFNLLPENLLISKSLIKSLKTIRALNVISIVGFLVFAVGIGAYFVYSTITLNGLNSSVDQLKSEVSAQESSEQQIILLKDRISDIESAKSQKSALGNITDVYSLIGNLSGNTSIGELDVDSGKVSFTMNIKSNEDLTGFMQSVESSNLFESVVLTSFGYNPTGGYVVGLSMVGK